MVVAVLVSIGFSAAVAGRPRANKGSDDPEDKPKSQSPTVITPMIVHCAMLSQPQNLSDSSQFSVPSWLRLRENCAPSCRAVSPLCAGTSSHLAWR